MTGLAMNDQHFLEAWELEKQRLEALGHEWSLADALRFSMQFAQGSAAIHGTVSSPAYR